MILQMLKSSDEEMRLLGAITLCKTHSKGEIVDFINKHGDINGNERVSRTNLLTNKGILLCNFDEFDKSYYIRKDDYVVYIGSILIIFDGDPLISHIDIINL